MSQLQNRFPPRVEQFWTGWHECLGVEIYNGKVQFCRQSHADCIHHIISPVAHSYIKGKHNESIFNSAPLNNENCNLGLPLQNEKTEKALLNEVYQIVMDRVDRREFELEEVDYEFLRKYKKFYEFL